MTFLKTQLTEKDKGNGPSGAGSVDVAILMCTYNGAVYLQEQLESFSSQSHTDWTLYVSDDGSTDETLSILADYQRRWGAERLVVFEGPRQGFGKNFISLLKRPEVQARYYAFSDQDDIWHGNKLERSVARLGEVADQIPALYCSRTRLIDANRRPIGFSPLFSRPPSFRNALVQSLAGANTMLINNPARDVLLQLPEDNTIVAHDWLAYLLVTACGGSAIYDGQPTLDYRQHDGNLIGANASVRNRVARFRKMLSGRFMEWNDSNLQILKALDPLLTQESRETLQRFESGRSQGICGRLSTLHKAGVYRQTPQGNLSLVLAACLGRV
jgi:glycosyltransferase involved in cell wall biosynthesis